MIYIILILALGVTGFAGVQFCYMLFLQATIRQQQRRIAELEHELIIARQAPDAQAAHVPDDAEEAWAELIDDGAS